jgi:hypothetical protein
MIDQQFLKQANFDMIQVDDDIEALLEKMKNYKPIAVPKWLKKGQV